MNDANGNGTHKRLDELVSRQIIEAIESLQFGAVEVTIHDGKVVQIDRRERTRIEHLRSERKER